MAHQLSDSSTGEHDKQCNSQNISIINENKNIQRTVAGSNGYAKELSAGTFSGSKLVVQEGDFVIFSAPNEAYTKWPDSALIIPNYIGQISRINTDGVDADVMLNNYNPCYNQEKDIKGYGDLEVNKKSRFILVADEKGNRKIVRKSSVCWLLSKKTKTQK